jgi:hypothetical protein
MARKDELLPCPLCQSADVDIGSCYVNTDPEDIRQPAARCRDCGCRATLAAWNTRASPPGELSALADELLNTRCPGECDCSDVDIGCIHGRAAAALRAASRPAAHLEQWKRSAPTIIANWLAQQYPDNSNTNAFCAAIRSFEFSSTDGVEPRPAPSREEIAKAICKATETYWWQKADMQRENQQWFNAADAILSMFTPSGGDS